MRVADALDALFRPECRADPFDRYAALRAAGPSITVAGHTILTRYHECSAALRDQRLHTNENAEFGTPPPEHAHNAAFRTIHRSVLGRDGPVHQRLRAVLGKPFLPREIGNLEPVVRRKATHLIDAMPTLGGPVDLIDEFAAVLPMAVLAEIVGFADTSVPALISQVDAMSYANDGTASRSELAHAHATAEALLTRAARLMETQPTSLTRQLAAIPVDEQTILANIVMLLAAGTETIRQQLGNTMRLLLDTPALADRLRDEPDLLPGYLTEILRMEPPAHVTSRWTSAPTTVGQARLPAGRPTLIVFAAANRDPNQFPDPDRLDPRRGHEGLAFGAGTHYCLGATLARLMARIGVEQLLRSTTRLTPAGPACRQDHLVIRGYRHLPATLIKPAK